jgi:hypothetical protein
MRRPGKHETPQTRNSENARRSTVLSLINVQTTAIRSMQNKQYKCIRCAWETLKAAVNGRVNSKPEFVPANQMKCIESV